MKPETEAKQLSDSDEPYHPFKVNWEQNMRVFIGWIFLRFIT